MYIKPALPCLPFFVVFSINLLSRPEREWEGDATERKWQSQIVTESKQKRTHFNKPPQMLLLHVS